VLRDWDASEYDRLPVPMTRWGLAVLERMPLEGNERVLDAGCGTGQVTQALLERLPQGEVIALDGSVSMIEQARSRLGEDRVQFLVADLLDPIPIDPVDAVISTATFHWIRDHDRLFRNLAAVLRPGGRLVAQCGGAGNIERVRKAALVLGHDVAEHKRFATPEETAERLEKLGFFDVRCWLHDEPTPLPADELPSYLRTVIAGDVVASLSDAEAEVFVRDLAASLDEPVIDYVRLNIEAMRA
jgi:trans-aconitate 2-methyltransferase